MSTENKNTCTQCPNQCPVDALRCGRGKAFFGEEGKMAEGRDGEGHRGEGHGGEGHRGKGHGGEGHGFEGHKGEGHRGEGHGFEGHRGEGHGDEGRGKGIPADPNSLYGLMRGCGHYLHHSQGNGGSQDENELFRVLSEEEREELKRLLGKVLESWK